MLEQNHDFSSDVLGIDPYKYPWRSKPHWADPAKRDHLVVAIDAEFTREFLDGIPVNGKPRPHAIWPASGAIKEPDFYRLDWYGRLALALALDNALNPEDPNSGLSSWPATDTTITKDPTAGEAHE